MSSMRLRPLRVGEILDASIKLYARNARTLIGAAAVAVIPLQLISAVVLMSVYSSGQDIPAGFSGAFKTVPAADASARAGASGITTLVSVLMIAFVSAVCVQAVSSAYLDHPLSSRESIRFGARRFLPLLAMLIVLYIGLGIGFVLLVIPGIWLYAAWGVATPALMIERLGPFRALGRSRRLVKGRWWAAAGVLLFSFLMTTILTGIVTGVLTAIALTSSNPSVSFAVLISLLSGVVSGLVVQPFQATVTTVLYYDLRVRHEGYDLHLLAEQLGLPEDSLGGPQAVGADFDRPLGPEMVGQPGGPPYWPPPPGWSRES
ncbi:MAG TPA: hypothetical protein VIY10_01665 [Solirubrobacteraceae bacterium]